MAMTAERRTERALERGRSLAERVSRVARGVYHVPSQSDPDGFHLVTDLTLLGVGEGLLCDCPAAEYGHPCAHRAAVVARRQAEEVKRLSERPQLRPVAHRHPRRQVDLT